MVQRRKMTERNVIKVSGAPEENKGENKKIPQRQKLQKAIKWNKSN